MLQTPLKFFWKSIYILVAVTDSSVFIDEGYCSPYIIYKLKIFQLFFSNPLYHKVPRN